MTSPNLLLEALRNEHPFAQDRINQPSHRDPDVTEIHARAFQQLVGLATQVARSQRAIGTVVLGDAGIGKSHVLSRFWRWSQQSGGAFVFLHNLLVEPARMPRYLLASTVSVLADRGRSRCEYGYSVLYNLLRQAIVSLADLGPDAAISPKHVEYAVRQLNPEGGRGADQVAQVLLRLFLELHQAEREHVHRPQLVEAALDWISGDSIDADAARKLGLNVPLSQEEICLRDDQDIELVFRGLTELARAANRPFILCLDQVDNLSKTQVSELTRFLHVLIDHCPNLLSVFSGVRANLLRLRDEDIIPAANWDRIAEEQVDLRPVLPEQALQIIGTRLRRFLEPYARLPEVGKLVALDPLFPLTTAWFEHAVGDVPEVRPRTVIREARRAWARVQSEAEEGGLAWLAHWPEPPAPQTTHRQTMIDSHTGTPREQLIDAVVRAKLQEAQRQRLMNPGSLPPDGDNISALLRQALELCVGHPSTDIEAIMAPARSRGVSPYAFVIHRRGKHQPDAVAVVATTRSATSTRLIGLMARDMVHPTKVLVTDEERRPIKITTTTEDHLFRLRSESDFLRIKLNFEQHAALDALVQILGLARVGDLEVDMPEGTLCLDEDEALASLHRMQAFRAHPALAALLPETAPLEQQRRSSAPPASARSSQPLSQPIPAHAPPSPAMPPVGPIEESASPSRPPPGAGDARSLILTTLAHGLPVPSASVAASWLLEHAPGTTPSEALEVLRVVSLQLQLEGQILVKQVDGKEYLQLGRRLSNLAAPSDRRNASFDPANGLRGESRGPRSDHQPH